MLRSTVKIGSLFIGKLTQFPCSSLKNNPELTHIAWLDRDGHMARALPSEIVPRQPLDALGQSTGDEALDLAKKLGKPVYVISY